MFIKTLYDFISFLKNQGQARYYNPEEVFRAFNIVSGAFYAEALPQWQLNSDVTAWLKPFHKRSTINQETDKTFLFPPDYYRESNLWYLLDDEETTIDIINEAEWPGRANNKVVGPDAEYPIANVTGDKILVRPKTITTIELSYFIKHPDVVFNYTVLAGRNIQFDETGSVDTIWPKEAHSQLVDRTLTYLGVPLKDQAMLTFKRLNEE